MFRKWRELRNRERACVPIALRDMFGEYPYQDEVEELLEEYDGGIMVKDIHILTEYIPDLYIFDSPSFNYWYDQKSGYVVFTTPERRIRIIGRELVIVVYDYGEDTIAHAQCITAHGYEGYSLAAQAGKLRFNMTIFNRRTMIVDREGPTWYHPPEYYEE